ncbi:MAG: tRNA pseudouridine(13) synthase TruD [Pseudomonadales bacterium]|nr:MAG: tRNA pseudouridine(13) synthase TruD [Pseudomonadales bacterium]
MQMEVKPLSSHAIEQADNGAAGNRWQMARDNSWARSLVEPTLPGKLRVNAEDFYVCESLRFTPGAQPLADRDCAHWLLKIEKHRLDTLTLQRQLAERSGAQLRDIGYAGLKDKHARCEQWMSIPARSDKAQLDRLKAWQVNGEAKWRVLEVQPQRKKLSRGANLGNQFVIVLRDVFSGLDATQLKAGETQLQQRVARLSGEGFPNYFGEQRFGLNANNLPRALSSFSSGKRISRNQRGLFLSALRSYLFNALLHQRVLDCSWRKLLPYDALVLEGSNSQFRVLGDETAAQIEDIEARLASCDLHIGGPLFGARNKQPDHCPELDQRIQAAHPDIVDVLDKAGMDYALRPLRVVPKDFSMQRQGDDVQLTLFLPSGSFATALLRELFDYSDVSRAASRNASREATHKASRPAVPTTSGNNRS